jgi:putative oxidoreductase
MYEEPAFTEKKEYFYRLFSTSNSQAMSRIKNSIFNPGNHTNIVSFGLLFLRVIAGAFMFTHGDGKLVRLFGEGPIKFSDPLGIGAVPSLALAVFAEVVCSVLVIVGVATRLSVIPVIITMLVAAFIVHGADPFGSRELPLLYASVFFFIAITGAGKFSFDNLIYKGSRRR